MAGIYDYKDSDSFHVGFRDHIGFRESISGLHGKPSMMAGGLSSPESVDSMDDDEKSRSSSVSMTTTVSRKSSRSYSIQLGDIKDVYTDIRHNLRMLDKRTYTDNYFDQLTYDSYRSYVANERLIRMPARGSFWDRALSAAWIFGENLWDFGLAIENFCPDAKDAAVTGLASCKILLEAGSNSKGLAPAFYVLFDMALLASQVIQIEDAYKHEALSQTRHSTVELYCHMVRLVGEIATCYTRNIDGLSNGNAAVKFESIFSDQVANTRHLTKKIVDDIWKAKLGYKFEGLVTLHRRLNNGYPARPFMFSHRADAMGRSDDSCEWFKTNLVEFFHGTEKLFTITGPVGSGKTVLAHWIAERLQRPLDHRRYLTLQYTFPFDSPKDATTLSFLKNILSQLLKKNVGDVSLYEKLTSAFASFEDTKNNKTLESGLWVALEAGLSTANDRGHPLVLVVDAFDEITDVSPSAFFKALREHIWGYSNVQAITLSRTDSDIVGDRKHLTLTPDLLVDNIRAFLWQRLSNLKVFTSFSEYLRDRAVDDLAQKAKGSFLWATIAANLLAKQTSTALFSETIQSLNPRLDGLLQKLITTLSPKSGSTHNLLSSMLMTERPLATSELADLMHVDIRKRKPGNFIDIEKELEQNYGDVVTVRDGRAHFTARPIKEFFSSQMGKSLPSVTEAQLQMTLRLLLYTKLSLAGYYEPSFRRLDQELVDSLFRSHSLLRYAVTNWLHHFRASPLFAFGGEISLTSEFKDILPDSALFALLERSCWGDLPTEDLINRHELALKVRETCFQGNGISTLQSLITLGDVYTHTNDATTAAKLFFRATKLGQVVLSESSRVAYMCATHFLQATKTISFSKRTELATWKISMTEFMIESAKAEHGLNSKAVLEWYQQLAELYGNINEEYKAAVTYKSIYKILVGLEGKESSRAREVAGRLLRMVIVLLGKGSQNMNEIEDILLETSESVDAVDATSIEIRWHLASFYMSQKKWAQAEDTFIVLWRNVSEAGRVRPSHEVHMNHIKIAMEYAKFLRQMKRDEEAIGILSCLWIEYENRTFESAEMTLRIKELGEIFRSFGRSETALSVFSKVCNWYKANGMVTHEEFSKTTAFITEIVQEFITKTTKTKTVTTITTTESTTLVSQIYETQFARIKAEHLDATFFALFFGLVKICLRLENWAQAETIIKQTLEFSWGSILSAGSTTTLSQQFADECLTAATYLALCYRRQGKLHDAEEIYLNVFRACLSSLSPDDKKVQESLKDVIAFYKEQHQQFKIVGVYKELLEQYRKSLGTTHGWTIELLYKLATECKGLQLKEEFTFYEQIVTALNKSEKYCHPKAKKAAMMLLDHYYQKQSWKKFQNIASLVWETFVQHNSEFKFDQQEIELLYTRYSHVLESHSEANYSAIYNLTHEYYTSSSAVFGASAHIVLKAMILFGSVCERDEKHYAESVSVYEELIKKTSTAETTTTITEAEITTVKKRLSKMYVSLIISGISTSTTTIERGIALSLEAYTQLQTEMGYWHESTLAKLEEIVLFYQKLDGKRYRSKITELLQTSFIGVITSSVSSAQLFTAATKLASIYVTAGLVEEGKSLVSQVQHLIIFGDSFGWAGTSTLRLNATVGKGAFALLTVFQQNLSEKQAWSYSETMASLVIEMSRYERYSHAVETDAKIETILEHGARLRALWHQVDILGGRGTLIGALDQRLFRLFRDKYGNLIDAEDRAAHEFYLALVVALGRTQRTVDFATLSCKAGIEKVASLLEKGEFKLAHQVARCVFHFANKQKFYHSIERVQYGYRLAEYMAGINIQAPTYPGLRDEMAKTSREIMFSVLEIFRSEGIEFSKLEFNDLVIVLRVLGKQQDHKDLEHILLSLWNSREVQSWAPSLVLRIGLLLVHAHHANGNDADAVHLCDRLRYNLHRGKGPLNRDTLAVSELLAALYVTGNADACRPERAIAIYENVLREVDAAACGAHSLYHDGGQKENLDATATRFLALLGRTVHGRIGSGDGSSWAKHHQRGIVDLRDRLASHLGVRIETPDVRTREGSSGDLAANEMYVPLKEWRLDEGLDGQEVLAH